MAVRGCFWIILSLITVTIIVLCAFLVIRPNKDWCTFATKAGDCEYFEEDEYCYCIDTFKYRNVTGENIYDSSREQCEALNGNLAAPDQNELTIWLAKRMYFMGVENAVVALRKILTKWYWIKPGSKNQEAVDIMWRKEFPPDSKHKQGILTVETVIKDMGDDIYIYYNYDHYRDTDESYQWFGFSTINKTFAQDAYYICKYDSDADLGLAKETDVDPCDCSGTDIHLDNLNDSQTFQSPQYPKNYCSDTNCKWLVSAEGDLGIQLDWLVFSLENDMDFVYIRDGHEPNSPTIKECTGWQCGQQQSSANQIQVHFLSDHVTTELGFRARVTAVENDVCFCIESLTVDLTNLLDTFPFYSPNFPGKYCTLHDCQWIFVAPLSWGLHVTFKNFDLEHSDYLFVHDGEKINNCTGNTCADRTSAGNEMRIRFVTDLSESTNAGFQAIVTVVRNFCLQDEIRSEYRDITAEQLLIKEEFLSDPRADGLMPVQGIATIICANNTKIRGTYNDTSDTVSCKGPLWNREIGKCIPLCEVEFSTNFAQNYEDVWLCNYDGSEAQPSIMVGLGETLTVAHYDSIHQQQGSEVVFTCEGNQWTDGTNKLSKIICETLTKDPKIAIFHGTTGNMLAEVFELSPSDYRRIEIYCPSNTKLNEYLDTRMLTERFAHASSMIPDGSVVSCGNDYEADSKQCERFFPRENKVRESEPLNSGRKYSASVTLNGFMYICGGSGVIWNQVEYHSSCERYTPGVGWKFISDMIYKRNGLCLVAYNHQLIAIGGTDSSPEESYNPVTDEWSEFPKLIYSRYNAAAAVMNEKLLVCGGGGSVQLVTCEQYSSAQDKWHLVGEMREERSNFQLVTIGNEIYAVGGDLFGTVEVFDGEEWSKRKTATKTSIFEITAVLIP